MSTAGRHHLEQPTLIIAKGQYKTNMCNGECGIIQHYIAMHFEIIFNDSYSVFGNLISVGLFVLLVVFLIILLTRFIWRKFRSYENLKYEFLTIIAHKFRTPLTQMKWTAETLLEKEQDSYKIESLKNIEQSNQNLIGLTGTLIELTDSAHTSLATYKLEKTDLCALTNKVVEILKKEFHEKNLFFGIQCSAPEIFVKADQQRIEFVLQTILENSIHYSPPGRNIDIEVSQSNQKAFVKVRDNGIGIDSEDIPHMFTKFFRTKNAKTMDTEGFGVGLFLSQTIMKRHKGKIEAFSAGLNQGSIFTVSLPLSK